MADHPRCEIHPYPAGGYATRRCANRASWLYVNGQYRRLECDDHAQITRRAIRYPEVIRLEPLAESGAMSD